jgi:Cellulase (glycosyl hydrolase family 5)
MLRLTRLGLVALVALLALPAAAVRAANHMPIGFYDDASFRWSPDRMQNVQESAAAGASVIHTTASWAQIAPKRPARASNGNDRAYRLADLDELVANASTVGMRVMIDITGTPKWANGGQSPNHMPKRLSDLTTFARMLADRYDGHHGLGNVRLWSVWNEPNLQLFLTPQFSSIKTVTAVKVVKGKRVKFKKTTFKIVGPANYAKLYRAAYAGIKAGNNLAQVAIGETSNLGRDKPISIKGQSQSVAPGTFARLLAQQKGLKFTAWATHPYTTFPSASPLQKVRYPNVTLSQLPTFEANLRKFFHRRVPVWITEYAHQTKPENRSGITYAKQAAYARQALSIARKDPNVQMFVWFTFRDSAGNAWKSGLERSNGRHKPSYAAFSALARLIDPAA